LQSYLGQKKAELPYGPRVKLSPVYCLVPNHSKLKASITRALLKDTSCKLA